MSLMKLGPAFACIILTTWCAPRCSSVPDASAFHAGMARAEVLQRFGEPNRMQAIIKSDEAIWGAIEEFWSQVPMGSTVEIWSYHVEGGSVELYFVDESPVVEGTGFAPEGVVFETSGAEDG